MKKVLVTAAGPNVLPILYQRSLPTFEKYAQEHGYEIKVVKLPSDDAIRNSVAQKEARWKKISIIRECLLTSDVVVWFDADVMICRYDDDIANHLEDNDYQGLVLHTVPAENRVNPNTGVWVIKNTDKSFRFLDAVESAGIREGRWATKARLCECSDGKTARKELTLALDYLMLARNSSKGQDGCQSAGTRDIVKTGRILRLMSAYRS